MPGLQRSDLGDLVHHLPAGEASNGGHRVQGNKAGIRLRRGLDRTGRGDDQPRPDEHELLVPTDETDSFIFDSKTGLRIPLKKGLVATGEVEFDHDHNPPLGVKKNDTTYSAKLGYEW